MKSKKSVSKITQRNWWVAATLAASALIAALSGLYFLYLPSGGYQGGRNPYYGLTILFSRHTWEDLHMWGGIAMIAIALFHIFYHWQWFVNMTRRALAEFNSANGTLNRRSRMNYLLNAVVAISFLITAASGVYFLFFPGERDAVDPLFLFSRTTWDLVHTWSGVIMIAAAVLHFVIHWRWVVNVSTRMATSLVPPRGAAQNPAALPNER
jgi:hypothetical protein